MGDDDVPKKSNKIRDIVRLQQMLKKWKKAAATTKNNKNNNINNNNPITNTTNNNNKTASGLNKFLKKTLSFSDISHQQQEDINAVVKKGYLAVWVGRSDEMKKKFVIPTDYLAHEAFSVLLRDAEEEFGFQQEGILKIPCDVPLFEKILTTMSSSSDNKKLLKSSSSTSSFFLYDQQQPQPDHCSSPHDHTTPPTTPTTHHLPLYCR